MNRSKPAEIGNEGLGAAERKSLKGELNMKSTLRVLFAVLALTAFCAAKELPDAPSSVVMANSFVEEAPRSSSKPTPTMNVIENKTVSPTFLGLALVSTGSTFADSYTTLFARENWLASKKGVCNVEVQSAYLYGTHPTVARAYAVASAKSAASVFAAYYLRKHHSRLWSLPLFANTAISLQGVTQNMRSCN